MKLVMRVGTKMCKVNIIGKGRGEIQIEKEKIE